MTENWVQTTYKRYNEGVFAAKTCSDCENWVQNYDRYLRSLLTRGIKKASLKLRLAATVRIVFRLTIATYERYKEGIFEAKTCSDCENWVQTYDRYLRSLLTRGIKKASLKLRLAATVRIGFRLTIATYERYNEGVFEAKTCSDCENWVQTYDRYLREV